MSDLVSIAGTAASAYQRALGVVSNNIANVGSAGYSRQEADLIENTPRAYGTSYLGTGVNFSGVRRMYDEFIENTLRNATTDLQTQTPLLNYANRVVNIMASEDVGLLSAFDEFFDSARQLSTDSSSLILRSQFLSKAEGLAERFQTLSGQLDLVQKESQEAIESDLGKLNNLSKQLATINGQLMKTKFIDRQPPALMDQRDQVLREMAELAKVTVREKPNGEVTVSLGSSPSRGVIVSGTDSQNVRAVFSESSVEKVDLVINPGQINSELISSLTGGSIAGLIGFRGQLLGPVYDDLDNLAKSLVQEVNAVHQEGIDLEGRNGKAMFAIDPQFSVDDPSESSQTKVSASLVDINDFEANELSLEYRANVGQINDLSLSGDFVVGDQIMVTLNSLSKALTLTAQNADGNPLPDGSALSLEQVQQQLRNFLEGGQRLSPDELAQFYNSTGQASLEGAFGRQLKVDFGAGNDLLVTSDVLGAYNLGLTVFSRAGGAVDNSITRGQWQVTDAVTGAVVTGTRAVDINGLRIEFSGEPKDNEILNFKMANRAAAGIRLSLSDPTEVASAARFRVIENQFNPTGTDAKLFETPERFAADEPLWIDRLVGDDGVSVLDNNVLEDVALDFDRIRPTPVAIVPAGYRDTTLYLGELNGEPIDLQVMTRDGRHLLGRQMADALIANEEERLGRLLYDSERLALVDQAGEEFLAQAKLAGVSFAEGSSYSAEYLNAEEPDTYRDMGLFYGVKSSPQQVPLLNEDHVYGDVQTLAAELLSKDIAIRVQDGDVIYNEGDLVLNGLSLGSLSLRVTEGQAYAVTQFTDREGRTIERQIALDDATEVDGVYTLDAGHVVQWMQIQPVWGRGEQQVLTFSDVSVTAADSDADGFVPISLTLPDGTEVSVAVPADAEAIRVAQAVEEALSADPYFADFPGRYLQVLDDGSLLVEFSTVDRDLASIQLRLDDLSAQSNDLTVSVFRDPAVSGTLGVPERHRLEFLFDETQEGLIRMGGIEVGVLAGELRMDVAQALAEKLRSDVVDFNGDERRSFNELGWGVYVTDDGHIEISYPAGQGNVTNLSFSSGQFDVDTGRLIPPSVGSMRLSVTEYEGLSMTEVLGESETGQVTSSLKLFQELSNRVREQVLSFADATGDGELSLGGVTVPVTTGMAGSTIASLFQQEFLAQYGSSSEDGNIWEFRLNDDGSLSVLTTSSSSALANLSITDAQSTGVTLQVVVNTPAQGLDPFGSDITLGLGETGRTTDLATLGFRTGVYISGEAKEDLLVFSTVTHLPDPTDPSVRPSTGVGFTLGATYTEGSRDLVESLRAEPFDIQFTSETRYQIIDRNTNTRVAEREYDPQVGISYRGLTMFLNTAPAAGDQFLVDGNQDGIGDNGNILRIASLQNTQVVGGEAGRTFADAYGQVVTDVGNIAFQASIAQKALEVVKDQAVQARDRVSGVSLDEEAADLIRFQQAYQANAKVMQTASALFDAILAIR